MIKILFPLPQYLVVAVSGGVDSMAVVDFLSRKHKLCLAFFHHGTEDSERAFHHVMKVACERNMGFLCNTLSSSKPAKVSQEEHWRNERYKFLESINSTVVTGHNLDDCVETYLHSSLNGQAKIIPFRRNNVVRPFLTTPKKEFVSWCQRKNVDWCEDLSNNNTKYMRNYIRHELMPHALHVNPGLPKVVKKLVEKQLTLDLLVNS